MFVIHIQLIIVIIHDEKPQTLFQYSVTIPSFSVVLLPSEIITLEKLHDSHAKFCELNPQVCAAHDIESKTCSGETTSVAFKNLLKSLYTCDYLF